ncbi:MAG: TetR family transcriptional regulator [Myxococcales bacterium]|nr:TetR family transcriptional regulator [Myxococcales bacterium]
MSRRPEDRGTLTREAICKEALALVDEEGLEALSMRRLGARLGVEAMSLYNHVRNKADLLDALHAAVLGGLSPDIEPKVGPKGDNDAWRPLLAGMARALHAALRAHPHVLPLFTTRPVTAPEALATIERIGTAFARARFSPAETEQAIYVVGMFTIGHAIFEANGTDGEARRRAALFRFGLEALLDGIERTHRRPTRKPSRRIR